MDTFLYYLTGKSLHKLWQRLKIKLYQNTRICH